jgi:hypothetical protein
VSTSRDYKNVIDHILYEAKRHGWDKDFDHAFQNLKVTIIPIDSTCYVGDCVVCHEGTMIAAGETSGICDACTPHVCIREWPGDDWCDMCGKPLEPMTIPQSSLY